MKRRRQSFKDHLFIQAAISASRTDWFSRFIRYQDVALYATNNGLNMEELIRAGELQVKRIGPADFVPKRLILQLLIRRKPFLN